MYEAGRADVPAEMSRFLSEQGGRWEVRWDARSERPHLVQGSGVPILPGRGNRLTRAQVGIAGSRAVQVEDVERLVRAFMARYPELFRIAPENLRLDRASSRPYGPEDRLWVIELQQYHEGVPVDGANVFFRISHGNIVQFGCDRIADVGIGAQPSLSAADARQRGLDTLGVAATDVAKSLDQGTLKIYPVLTDGERSGERYGGLAGFGYAHRLVWEPSFRLRDDAGTYRVSVDAQTGALLAARDLNAYATVQGGIYPTTNTDAEVTRPFSFATVSNGGTKNTDAAGVYNYIGRHGHRDPERPVLPDERRLRRHLAVERGGRQPQLREQRGHGLHDAGRRRRGQHPCVALGLLPPHEHQPEGDQLPAGQLVAELQGHGQHEHQPDLQRVLERQHA